MPLCWSNGSHGADGGRKGHTHTHFLVHCTDEPVDGVLAVAVVTALDKVVALLDPTARGGVELEWPDGGVDLLELAANGENLVDKVLHADDAVLAKALLNHLVVCDWDAVLVDLQVAALEQELAHRLDVGVAVERKKEEVRGGKKKSEGGRNNCEFEPKSVARRQTKNKRTNKGDKEAQQTHG